MEYPNFRLQRFFFDMYSAMFIELQIRSKNVYCCLYREQRCEYSGNDDLLFLMNEFFVFCFRVVSRIFVGSCLFSPLKRVRSTCGFLVVLTEYLRYCSAVDRRFGVFLISLQGGRAHTGLL